MFRACPGRSVINEIYEPQSACLSCYESDFSKLRAIHKEREKIQMDTLSEKVVPTENQVKKPRTLLNKQFEKDVKALREEFDPYRN